MTEPNTELHTAQALRPPLPAPEQSDTVAASREKLPPPEQRDDAGHGAAMPVVGAGMGAELPSEANAQAPVPSQKREPEQEKTPEKGNWFHRNRWFTKEPISYVGYQFVRSSIATIPYGFGMAGVHHLFGLLSAKGQKMGLNEAGQKAFAEGVEVFKNGEKTIVKGLAAVDQVAAFEKQAGLSASVGRNMMRFANSPINIAMQIATGFTMFRFTGGVVKNVRDRIMNEKNTAEDTDRETRNIGHTIKETAAINWRAESTGTPIAALALGFMASTFSPSMQPVRDKINHPGMKGFFKQVGTLWSPKSKLAQNAAIWTVAYSTFFLLAEELFRDVQVRRGLWKGHPNSLKNGPDDVVGGPGAISYKTPEDDPAYKFGHDKVNLNGRPNSAVQDENNDTAKDSEEKLRFPALTGEPSIGRFVIRRILPVAVGISAYAALKRVGYLKMGGPMKPLSVPEVDGLKTAGDHAKFFLENAKREGGATAMFGALWVATDAWGSFYDKFVHKLQKPENAVPLNEHQQQKHNELLARVNAKEQGQGRAA